MGHDVVDTRELSLQTTDDDSLWELAKQQKRFFITFDLDFADLREYTPTAEMGTVVFRTKSTTSQTVIRLLKTLFNTYSQKELSGRLIIVTESQFRIRK